MFKYFSKFDADQYKFYRIPKELIINPEFTISFESKILYGILLDRLELSEQNRWEDENGYVYIYFPLQSVMNQIQCKKNKAIKLMNELQSLGLIEKKYQGQNKPNRIYVKKFISFPTGNDKTLDPFFSEMTADQYCFYKIPKELLSNESFKSISFESKILYSFLLERVGWSEQSRWTDDDGKVYIYFSIESVMEYFHCQREKAVKLMDTLVKFNFIEKKRQGQGKPNRIYVKNFMGLISSEIRGSENRTSESRGFENRTSESRGFENRTSESRGFENRTSESWGFENRTSGGLKIELLGVGKSNSIKTEKNKTELSSSSKKEEDDNQHTLFSLIDIQKQIDFDYLQNNCPEIPKNYLDLILDVMFDTLNSEQKIKFKVNNHTVSHESMVNHLLNISHEEIEFVVESILSSDQKITNPHKYILSSLYNAKTNLDFTITNNLKKEGII